METTLLKVDTVPLTFDRAALFEKLHINPGQAAIVKKFEKVMARVLEVAHPKAIARLCEAQTLDDNTVSVNGVCFTSPLLREKIGVMHRCFIFVNTEGLELAEWAAGLQSSLEMSFAYALRAGAADQARALLLARLQEKYAIKHLGFLSPGGHPTWAQSQLEPLLGLLEDIPAQIGVTVRQDDWLLSPVYSLAGIAFQTGQELAKCELRPRKDCPARTPRCSRCRRIVAG